MREVDLKHHSHINTGLSYTKFITPSVDLACGPGNIYILGVVNLDIQQPQQIVYRLKSPAYTTSSAMVGETRVSKVCNGTSRLI